MRHFTPEEANAALVEVRPLVEQMVERRREHAEALERQEQLEGRIRGNGGGIPPASSPTRPPRSSGSSGSWPGSWTRSSSTARR